MVAPGDRFGKLCLVSNIEVSHGSHRELIWLCDCGKETEITVKRVTSGGAKSCGRCNEISEREMSERKFGRLRMKNPGAILPGSGKKEIWICDCGNETDIPIRLVISGNTKSCGRCNEISEREMSERKFGRLRMKGPRSTRPNSHTKTSWICDCGREARVVTRSVISGVTKSCGRCNEISKEEMFGRRFGHLRMKDPETVLPGSNRKAAWICDCGQETEAKILSVTSGNTKSCGRCYSKASLWWNKNKDVIRSLKCPIDPINIPDGFIALERIRNTKNKFNSICPACGKVHLSKWGDIRQGRGITCGCTYNGSSINSGVASFVKSFGLSVITEYNVNGLKYDIYIPDKNLLIEMNGLKWHSVNGAKQRDAQKYQNALESGHKFMMMFEDEWKKGCVSHILANIIGTCFIPIRSTNCVINKIGSAEANEFYDKHHYIGKCNPTNSYGAFFNEKLIACISFGRPTRQNSKFEFELLRMASNSVYKVYGIWSKMLLAFIHDQSPISIVSFSDNRLFSGDVYSKLGFRLDGFVKPDYYWTNGYRRFHKSSMKKKGPEKDSGFTESELRTAQGYSKIWDLGKKRWVYAPSN